MLSEGRAPSSEILAWTQSTTPLPPQARTGIVVIADKRWRRDAEKLSMNRGKFAVYLILLTGFITDCGLLLFIRLIIWTCSSWTLLIKHLNNEFYIMFNRIPRTNQKKSLNITSSPSTYLCSTSLLSRPLRITVAEVTTRKCRSFMRCTEKSLIKRPSLALRLVDHGEWD